MGFDLMTNFRMPYLAVSPSDFWRRWHISLSTWLRDYLYIPLGGNRGGKLKTYRNLMITMLLGGLWHGAAMPFVIWGAYHGLLLVLHRLASPQLARISPQSPAARTAWHGARVFAMFHLTCLGLLIFRSETTTAMMAHLAVLFGPFEWGLAPQWLLPFGVLIAPLVLIQIAQARSGDLEVILRWPLAARVLLYCVLATMIVIMGEDGGDPFIYFQF
jgi:alginate O-acetyltransferase complex protein AlgI